MAEKFVITIGREYGSGGRQIGRELADLYGIKFYDKELLSVVAKESGISEDLLKSHDEKPTNSFLYSLVMDTYSMGYSTANFIDMPINQKIFMAQYDTIKKIAQTESCVIVGRCADYALANNNNAYSVFIHASLEAKIKRIMRIYDYSEDKAKDLIIKTDKKRASYYNFYSNKKWGDSRSYDMCIDSTYLGVEETALAIKNYVDMRIKNGSEPKGI